METTISIMIIISISSFATGWFLKHQNIYNTLKIILEDIQKATKSQNSQLLDTYRLYKVSEEKEGIRTEILRLKEYQKQVLSMVQEIEQEYLQKIRIIEENKKTKSESQQRLEKLKSKSSELKQ